MKTTLEQEDIQAIAEKVVELFKPYLLNGKQDDQEVILDKDQLAEYLNVDVSWIDKNYEDKLPHFHLGKYPRFKKSKIDKWIDSHNTRRVFGNETTQKKAS